MKLSTNTCSSSIVLFLSLGVNFANTVSARNSVRGLGIVAPQADPPAIEPAAVSCLPVVCGIGTWSAFCNHLQTTLDSGGDFESAMGSYTFTATELQAVNNGGPDPIMPPLDDFDGPGRGNSTSSSRDDKDGGDDGDDDDDDDDDDNKGPSKTSPSPADGTTSVSISGSASESAGPPAGPSATADGPPSVSISDSSSSSEDGPPAGPSASAADGPPSVSISSSSSSSEDGPPAGPSASAAADMP